MSKAGGSKRGFNCPSFKVIAHSLHPEPFTAAMLHDCWHYYYPKSVPTMTQISMLLRGNARCQVYLVESYHSRTRRTSKYMPKLGRNSIYKICPQWIENNPISKA